MGAIAKAVGNFFTNPIGTIAKIGEIAKDAVTLNLGGAAKGVSDLLNGSSASESASGSANDMLMAAVQKLLGKSGMENDSDDLQSDMG